MADFCKECSIETFGEDTKDLAGISTETDTEMGLYAQVLCVSCGYILVDHNGKCVQKGNSNVDSI